MRNKCIYCGADNDLSRSDIIPDALTNAKIINPNVCRVEHNNKFSDLFESEVIEKLAIITNELDIKSSKSSKYASYSAKINVAGTEYNAKISSEADLFRNRKMRSTDEKFLLGPIDEIKKIKTTDETNIREIDVNQIEIEKIVNIDLAVFFSPSMYRLVAKIAFEWYCVNNNVSGKIDSFEPIIQFITRGLGEGMVSVAGNIKIYNFFGTTGYGSHTLFSYIGKDNSVNIIVCLFGIVAYNVCLSPNVLNECKYNVLFQELRLDAKRSAFAYDTFDNFVKIFKDSFEKKKIEHGMTAMIPKDMKDITLQYKMFYATSYVMFQNGLDLTDKPTDEVVKLILKNLESILQTSAVTIRGLKRFVKEHFKSFDEKIRLNPRGSNKKSVFMFYLLLIVGQSNGAIKDLKDLNKVLKEKFSGETISISDELSTKLNKEIFSIEDHSDIILKGAKAIEGWDYE